MGDGMTRLALGLISALVVAWTALLGWDQWVNYHRIVAGPDNESSLYQSYDPERVIKNFRCKGENYGGGHGSGALQLIKYIRHSQDFTPRFTMQAKRERQLLNALREDIILQLRITGMTLVATEDEADGGFTYKYTSENSSGSISVQAPVYQMTIRRYPVPTGLDDVELKIALEETWTRPASESQWWMSAVD
jgi:hypothetical protein